MAISYVGSNTQDAAGALALTFTVPAATTTDDLILVFVKQSENTGQQTWDDDGGGGNGYTRLDYNRTTGGRDMETAIYYKYATSGSETNPTFTWNTSGTTEPMSGIMEVYRGVDPDFVPVVSHINAQNDANPPNPTSPTIAFDDSWVVCFHGATHDDITAVAAPTGFTLRSQVWAGTANDHRNVFSADISNIDVSADPYTPPDWQHTVANTTPEYHTYTVLLTEDQPIAITGGTATASFVWGASGLTITGKGFGATQSTGKVEYWDDTSGTTKTVQTIDTWSDTSITIDTVQGSLPNDTTIYLVVTNSSSQESNIVAVGVGLLPYHSLIVDTLNADHYWRLNNTYNDTGDTGPVRNMTSGVVGTWTFNTQEIVDGNTHSLNYSNVTNRREIADSANMNVTITAAERTISFWLQINTTQHELACIWKEGGGVQNLAMLLGYGNVMLWQLADVAGTRDNVQAWSDFKLSTNRPYNIVGRYSNTENPAESRLYIDGVLQTDTDGNPMTINIFDSHSGDVVWGDPDNNLETGATDISYNTHANAQLSDFATWSDNSGGTNAGGLDPETEIRDILFRRGAIPDDTLATATESSMQTSLEALDENRPDWPLSLRVEPVTGGGDFELIAQDSSGNPWVFDAGISAHIEYRGVDTLTVINPVGGNLDAAKCWSQTNGTVSVINEVTTKVTCRDAADPTTVISGARVLILAADGAGGGGGSISIIDVQKTFTSSTSFELDVPTHQEGDLMLLFLGHHDDAGSFDVNESFTEPANVAFGSTSGTDRQSTWQYKIATDSEPATYTVSYTGGGGQRNIAVCVCIRNVDQSNPLDVTPTTSHRATGDNDANPPNQSITTVTDNAMVWVYHYSSGAQLTGAGAPTDYTIPTEGDGGSELTNAGCIQIAQDVIASFGAESPGDWTSTGAGTEDYHVHTLAVRPEAAGATVPLPVDETVTITRSGSVATVTHTAHGLAGRGITEMLIEGANQGEYNGLKTITIVDANSYTFTVSGTPTTPATGTITATAVIISGVTDINGEIEVPYRYFEDQNITGIARKGSSSPYYKTGELSSTITVNGADADIFMIRDE